MHTASTLAAHDIQRIANNVEWREKRVAIMQTDVGEVVIKGHRAARHPIGYKLLDILARATGVPMLQSAPMHGGKQAQAIELRRLKTLHAAGAHVPQVLHVADDFFVAKRLGNEHLVGVLQSTVPTKWDLWQAAAQEILRVHQAQQYFSQCFGRNVMIDSRQNPPVFAGMIDFEDDPLEVMQLHEAQVRDWFTYLQSTVWLLAVEGDLLAQVVHDLLAQESIAVQKLFVRVCKKMAWLRFLPRSRSFGRDTIEVQAVAQFAHQYLTIYA